MLVTLAFPRYLFVDTRTESKKNKKEQEEAARNISSRNGSVQWQATKKEEVKK